MGYNGSMSRAFTKERDDAPEPAVRLARTPTGQVTPEWYDATRRRLDKKPIRRSAPPGGGAGVGRGGRRPGGPQAVAFGATVSVMQGVGAQRNTSRYTIVGDVEADVRAGKIGATSPLAQALLGAQAGKRVVWHRPAGDVSLRVESVSYDSAAE